MIFIRIIAFLGIYCVSSSNTLSIATVDAKETSSVQRIYISTKDGNGNKLEKYE